MEEETLKEKRVAPVEKLKVVELKSPTDRRVCLVGMVHLAAPSFYDQVNRDIRDFLESHSEGVVAREGLIGWSEVDPQGLTEDERLVHRLFSLMTGKARQAMSFTKEVALQKKELKYPPEKTVPADLTAEEFLSLAAQKMTFLARETLSLGPLDLLEKAMKVPKFARFLVRLSPRPPRVASFSNWKSELIRLTTRFLLPVLGINPKAVIERREERMIQVISEQVEQGRDVYFPVGVPHLSAIQRGLKEKGFKKT